MSFLINPSRFAVAGGGGGIEVVQSATAFTASGNDISAAFSSAVTAGNAIIAAFMTPSTITSFSDNNSNTYNLDYSANNGTWYLGIYSVLSANAGSTTATLDINFFARDIALGIYEVSGLTTGYDTAASAILSGFTTTHTASVTSSNDDSLFLFGTCIPNSDGTFSSPPGGDGTWIDDGNTAADPTALFAHQQFETAGEYDAQITYASNKSTTWVLGVYY